MTRRTLSVEHDYTRQTWGHAINYRTKDEGQTLTGTFHNQRRPIVGDHLILPNGDRTTRYRITDLRWFSDPGDQWAFTAAFDPRRATQGETK